MAEAPPVWIDAESCTACGACIDACPAGAITLNEVSARVNEMACTRCGTCLDVCPQDAIRLVVKGELVTTEEPAVIAQRRDRRLARSVERAHPLVENVGPAVVAVGVGLLVRAADALARAVSRCLTRRAENRPIRPEASQPQVLRKANGGGRRTRRRRRGS